MRHRKVDVARPSRAVPALLASAAAAVLLGPLTTAAAAPTDGLPADPTDAVDDVLEDTTAEAADAVDDLLEEVTEPVTEVTGEVVETADDATTTVTDVVDDVVEPAGVATPPGGADDGDPPGADGNPGGNGSEQASTGTPRHGGDDGGAAPAVPATAGAVAADDPAALPGSGQPAGGFALVALRSMLVPGTAAEADVPPPLVSGPEAEAEAVDAPQIAGQEQLASIRMPPPPSGGSGWLSGGLAEAGSAGVPASLAVTAGGLVLLLGGAHALHAAGYLRRSFVKAPD